MGDEMFPVRLLFRDGRGCAKHTGVRIELTRPPQVAGIHHLVEIDWWPFRGEVRVSAGGWRETTRAEGDAVMALLERIATAARAALEGEKP